jgi:GT2 family glycosyltransferase
MSGEKTMIDNKLDRLLYQAHQSVITQQQGDLAGALAGYEIILENLSSYENGEHDSKIGEILRLLLQVQNCPALMLYIHALHLFHRRQYQSAYSAVETAILLDSGIPQLHLLKARILDAFGNTKESATISDGRQEALFMSQAASEMPGIDYYGWLQRIHELLRPAVYVEIGLGDGRALSLTGPKTLAIGIDPYKGKWELLNYGSPHGSTMLFHLSSDDFFSQYDLRDIIAKETFDLAFIDGLHHFDQALKDFINLERYAGKNSIILIHDCLPVSPLVATRERNTAFWTGDVWRIIPCLKTFRPDLRIMTIPTRPSGLTIVTGMDPESQILTQHYETIVKYYAGVNLPTAMSERFALLNVHQSDWDKLIEIITPELMRHKPITTAAPQVRKAALASSDDGLDSKEDSASYVVNSMPMPKVSIINVICGNNIEFMGKCLNSLISNTDYPNFELIIVTDSGKEMKSYISSIAEHNPVIKCVYRDTRHSNASNRNVGALNASNDSQYYLFVDSDVMYSNNQWLMNQVNIIEENADIGMIGGGEGNTLGHYCFIDKNRGVLINVLNEFNDLFQNQHIEMMIIPGYNMLMRREVFTAIGGWDEGFTPVYGEDIDICLRCILAGYKVFGMHNKGVHHLYRDTKENNSSELLVSDIVQNHLNLASIRRLALKYEGILPTTSFQSFQEWFAFTKKMRDSGKGKYIKSLPPTVIDGKINHIYLPLTNTVEVSKIYNAITLD